MGENTPEGEKARRKPVKDKKKIAAAGQTMVDMAAALKDMAPPGTRLLVDMPLDKGEIRLTLVERTRRISVWGKDMDEALERLLTKAELTKSSG